MKLIQVCNYMQRHGITIDRKFINDGLEYEQREIEEAKKDFETNTGRAYKNSSKLFAEIFDERGEHYPKTPKGNPSFTADFLDSSDTPTTKLIKRIRHHEKRSSTYWTSFLYYADSNNVLYPNFNQAATVTGRFSSSAPNLQNLPSEDDEADRDKTYLIRRAFTPRPGHRFFSIDYSQQEYRLMLDYAGEQDLIREINAGQDVHTAIAERLKIPRKQAKTVSFALLYGTGIAKLAIMLGVTEDEARRIKNHYFSKLPKVRRLIRNVVKTGETRGFIYNWLGRRYWCSDFKYSYVLPNHLIQGGGADIIKRAMVDIYEQVPESGICLQVHDELVFEMPDDSKVSQIVDIMEGIYKPMNGLRMKVDVDYSSKSLAKWDMESYERSTR